MGFLWSSEEVTAADTKKVMAAEDTNVADLRKKMEEEKDEVQKKLDQALSKLKTSTDTESKKRAATLQRQMDEMKTQNEKDRIAAKKLEADRKKLKEDVSKQTAKFNQQLEESDKKHTELLRSKDVAQLKREAQTLWETRQSLAGPLLKAYVESAKKLVAYMRMKKQVVDEQLLVETRFGEEVKDPDIVRVVLYGPTGHGKSTLANRLCGDTSEEAESGPFKTSGGVSSETSEITKVMAEDTYVNMATKTPMRVSITDQPGTGDSLGRDRRFAIELVNYLRGIDFINAIFIVKNGTMPRFDAAFQQMLQGLTEIMGPDIWKNIVLVLTFRPKKRNADAKRKFFDEIRGKLKELIPSVDFRKLPIVEADAYDLEQCTPKLKALICGIVPTFAPFVCADLKSPLDQLLNDAEQARTDFEYTMAPWKLQLARDKKYAIDIEDLQKKLVELMPDEVVDTSKKAFPLPGIKNSFTNLVSAFRRMTETAAVDFAADDEKTDGGRDMWVCANCSFDWNDGAECVTCDAPFVEGTSSHSKESGWYCMFCAENNATEKEVCHSCQMARI